MIKKILLSTALLLGLVSTVPSIDRSYYLEQSLMTDFPDYTEGVYKEWISAIKEGKQAGSDFAGYAGPMTEMILIGCLATRMGRSLEMDPVTGVIKNATPPSEWVNPTFRSGWTL